MLKNVVGRMSFIRASVCKRAFSANIENYGQQVFKGAVAAPFLEAQGLSRTVLEQHQWTTDGKADKVRLRSALIMHENQVLTQ